MLVVQVKHRAPRKEEGAGEPRKGNGDEERRRRGGDREAESERGRLLLSLLPPKAPTPNQQSTRAHNDRPGHLAAPRAMSASTPATGAAITPSATIAAVRAAAASRARSSSLAAYALFASANALKYFAYSLFPRE